MKSVCLIMFRKGFAFLKRLRRLKYLFPFVVWVFLSAVTLLWLGEEVGAALRPPPPVNNLDHFRRSVDLSYYLDNIQLLVEPARCSAAGLVALVASAAPHAEHRAAARASWAREVPAYFVLGVDINDEYLSDIYAEARAHGDMVVFDLVDHYQNLTLKTMLMLQWTRVRCPHAQFLFKTDDDVVVNPWLLREIVKKKKYAHLIGYAINDTFYHREPYNKWFVPRWLQSIDFVPRYLSGTGYLLNCFFLNLILEKAKTVPLMNLEDVYLTYLVSMAGLQLELTHDHRLSPWRPLLPFACGYYRYASLHSFGPYEIHYAYSKIKSIHEQLSNNNSDVCSFYNRVVDSFV